MLKHARVFGLIFPLALVLLVSTASDSVSRSSDWLGWTADDPRILVFSKTEGFRHTSIEPGIAAIQQLGEEHGFAVDVTEDAGAFTQNNLETYDAVVFLNTTGDVLDAAQQAEFERFIQAGGGYVGIHAAADTEYEWPWYGRLAGAYFESHPNNPNVREGAFVVQDTSHPSTEGLPERWERADEFYNFRSINPDLHVLVTIDESTYEGGTNGEFHPMAWYHEYDGGRAWYTAMGHTDASYSEPLFLQHLLGGIRYAMGDGVLDFGRARPEENRFNKVVLTEGLNEPLELAVLPDGRVLYVERGGVVHLYSPSTGNVAQIATIPVTTTYTNGEVAEDGLLGVAADPDFTGNGWIYLYYSAAGDDPKNVLSRFTMDGDALDLSSEVVMLEVAVQREECCHTGGSIAFDAEGNLYVSTGDNTNPFATGYAPIDERPGRGPWDAQKSSANTNDLRGKILRITPQADGTYTIPEGNLFEPGTPQTRPEIYTMGHRNPYRIAIDQRTGYLYWGDVGPDASTDSLNRGPAGHDEFNQARAAGNFGWPHFTADNKAYHDFDFAAQSTGPAFDPADPVNDSPNNTGLTDLPPAQPAFIWYPAAPSETFPPLGSGGRSAMAGPIFYRDDLADAERPFPEYYDGKLFIYEWMRGWIIAVTMDEEGDLVSMERFMPSHRFSNPIDMEFGPNGDLYVLEYGSGWFSANDDARLARIEYNAGNRTPVAAVSVDAPAGAVPHAVTLSSNGTTDADSDALEYEWTISDASAEVVATLTDPNPTYSFDEPGVYVAALTVTDEEGATAMAGTQIVAGNEPPEVEIELTEGNRSFFFPGTPIAYNVRVRDSEDGSLEDGEISADQVAVTADFLREGFDQVEITQGHRAADAAVSHAAGRRLVEEGTCLSCHQVSEASIGPSYEAIAQEYEGDSEARDVLATKIREGGSGVWGDVMMPPHPQLSEGEARQMVDYILGLADEQKAEPSMPVRGTYTAPASADEAPDGVVVLRAAHTDRGANGLPGASAEETLVLRPSTVLLASGEISEGAARFSGQEIPTDIVIATEPGAFVRFEQIDLTEITEVRLVASTPSQLQATGGIVEVRLDAPDGPLAGQTGLIRDAAAPTPFHAPLDPTTGMHDVYFVFERGSAEGDGGLFILTTAEFAADSGAVPPNGGEAGTEPAGRESTAGESDEDGQEGSGGDGQEGSDGDGQTESGSNVQAESGGDGQAGPGGDGQTEPGGLSTRSTIGDLLDNDAAKAVLEEHVPGLTTNPELQQAVQVSQREIAPFAPDVFTEEALEAIDRDLAGI